MRLGVNALSTQLVQVNSDSLIVAARPRLDRFLSVLVKPIYAVDS